MKVIKGNIFATTCQTVVNTVNCVGVMGAGIAYEFRLRYPGLYQKYVELCNNKSISIGSLWLFKAKDKWILNFPTKYHWKYPTKIEYLHKGLEKFLSTYKEKGITSVAFPLLGASNGGLDPDVSFNVMQTYLNQCDIPVEVYFFDKNVNDNLYEVFKSLFLTSSERELADKTGLRIDFVKKVKSALESEGNTRLMDLRKEKGIGEKTLEKAFYFVMNNNQPSQLKLEYPDSP
jgi:O-acetyl-ADP-ribose deacetylase (regulator of RNase III)